MSDIRLVNVIPIVNGWNDVAKKNLDEAKTLMASGNYSDYNAGVIKEGVANLISGLADDLIKAPAVDPETLRPVGLWTLEGNDDDVGCSYFCSNCGKSVDEDCFFPSAIPGLTGTEFKPLKYCPYCGAKMKE